MQAVQAVHRERQGIRLHGLGKEKAWKKEKNMQRR